MSAFILENGVAKIWHPVNKTSQISKVKILLELNALSGWEFGADALPLHNRALYNMPVFNPFH